MNQRRKPRAAPAQKHQRRISAITGTELHCKSWQIEGAYRMLHNVLDPEVAKDPDHLIVYGGTGRAARSWDALEATLATLEKLEEDQTLLIQSGKPVAVFKTHRLAPRILIVNSMIVPKWATWDYFYELEQKGLIMYGQMTAGSWAYIGTQGILQGTYETLAAVAKEHFHGTLAGRLVLTAGLGEMGGAQPLAVTMNDGIAWQWRSTRRPSRKESVMDICRPSLTTWTRRWIWFSTLSKTGFLAALVCWETLPRCTQNS